MTSDVNLQRQRIRIKQKMLQRQQGGLTATGQAFSAVGPNVAAERLDERQSEQANIEQQLGAPFSRTDELKGFGARMGLATQEGAAEKTLRLQKNNPDFDVRTINTNNGTQPLTVFQRPGEPQFQAIDKPGGAITGDIADVIGSVGNLENLASIVATKGAGGPLMAALRSVVGGIAGNEADSQLERVQGTELATGPERIGEQAISAGANLIGEGLGSTLTRGKQIAKGERGIGRLPTARTREALRIVDENPELENLSAGQVSTLLKRRQNQVSQTGEVISDFEEKQGKALVKSIEDLIPTTSKQEDVFSDRSLMDIGERAQKSIFKELGETPGSEEAVRGAGRGLQEARESLVETRRAEKNQLFDEAFTKATPDVKFDISAAQKEAGEAVKGVTATGKEGAEVRIGENFSAPMKSAVETLNSLQSTLESEAPQQSFEQIKALRTQFFDLKQPDPQTGTFTNEARIAGRIHKQLTEAIKNPVGGADEFVGAFGAANKANVDFENLVNTKALKDIARSENPQQLFKNIASAGNFEQLALLSKELPDTEFKKLGSTFDEFLRIDPGTINKTLDGFARDQASLRKLLPKTREAQLRVLGNSWERANSAPVVKVLKSTGDAGQRALEIMEGGTNEQFKTFIDGAVSANNADVKETKAALLHGVVTKILKKHKALKDGRVEYNMNKIATELQGLIETGRMKEIAEPAVLRALKERSFVASILGASKADVGASMSAGATAGAAATLDPTKAPMGYLGVIHDQMWARGLTNPKTVRLIAGKGARGNPVLDNSIRSVSRLLGVITDDITNAPRINFKDEPKDEE